MRIQFIKALIKITNKNSGYMYINIFEIYDTMPHTVLLSNYFHALNTM